MSFDILIKNGRVIDGTGSPWFSADIGIKNNKIAKIGRLDGAKTEIDAMGLVVSPGFVDPHSHADWQFDLNPKMESSIRQGVTTLITGNCGITFAPIKEPNVDLFTDFISAWVSPDKMPEITWRTFGEFLEQRTKKAFAGNVAYLVGHGTIRIAAMGIDNREPTFAELEDMKELTAEAMTAGAFGMSTGLIYPPGIYAKTSELIELAKIIAMHGGVYFSHIRGEGDTVVDAVNEAIVVGEKGNLPAQVSHHKVTGRKNWGRSVETLAAMEAARGRGVDVTFDQYPYPAGSTSLATLLPPWMHEGGLERLLDRLRDPNMEQRIRQDIVQGLPDWDNIVLGIGWKNVVVSSVKTAQNKDVEGKNLKEIMEMKKKPDEFTALRDLLLEEDGTASMIIFSMGDEDIHRIMQHPLQMVGSDSGVVAPYGPLSDGKPHPRAYGTFTRVLGRYVREKKILILEDAIRKMTSFAAQRIGLWDRGVLRPGMVADVVVFDATTVVDNATFKDPHQYPSGVKYVLVNGQLVIEEGEHTGVLPGKVLKHSN